MRSNIGKITALAALGLLLGLGQPAAASVDSDLKEAWTLYNIGKYKKVLSIVMPLASGGQPDAQVLLGDCYENGLGIGRDPEVAVAWYKLAAEQGSPAGLARLGYAYNVGFGIGKDRQKAMECMREAARLGDPGAAETLAIWETEGR